MAANPGRDRPTAECNSVWAVGKSRFSIGGIWVGLGGKRKKSHYALTHRDYTPHTHTHTHTHTHMHTRMHTYTHMCAHAHIHKHAHTYTHAHTKPHTNMHSMSPFSGPCLLGLHTVKSKFS
jgi:hypothetical protein